MEMSVAIKELRELGTEKALRIAEKLEQTQRYLPEYSRNPQRLSGKKQSYYQGKLYKLMEIM